tara:strand:+ start:43 stop:1275 length:1233 start_codon:yes stop_codon:yes gene_type:complete
MAVDTTSQDFIERLRKEVQNFDFEKKQSSYKSRLGELAQPPRSYNLFDLATDLSRGLTAQQQTDRPNSLAGGLALGFGEASQQMKEKDAAYAKARREVGLEAARLAMKDEQDAINYLNQAEFEIAKGALTGKGTTLMRNADFLGEKREELRLETDPLKKEIIQREIDDVIGLGSVGKYDPELRALVEKAIVAARQGTEEVLTPGEIAGDTDFAKKLNDWNGGEAQQTQQNLVNLNEKLEILLSDVNISGPAIGQAPEAALAFTHPKTIAFVGDIRDVVFQSLRATLGAQFTENEGNRLVAAAFDLRLGEEENYKRLKRLVKKIEGTKIAMESQASYWAGDNESGQTGTLKGYVGSKPTFDELYDSVLSENARELSDEQLIEIYQNPLTSNENKKLIATIARERAETGATE